MYTSCASWLKRVLWLPVFFCLLFVLSGAGAVYYNNRNVELLTQDELSQAFEASVVWLVENENEILEVPNPILWYFLQRSAEISGDKRLQALFEAYYARYIAPARNHYQEPLYKWVAMFDPEFNPGSFWFDDLAGMNYYSQFFVYAIGCDRELIRDASIQAQNSAGFCGNYSVLRPTCTTHQLMGIRFLQRKQCGDPGELSSVVEALQAKIVRELTLDPRVVDVYVQRVLMLVESGGRDRVKDVWIRRVLDLQQADGGWGNFQPLVPLDDSRYIGFGFGDSRTGVPREGDIFLKGFSTGKARSTFHATAQGVLLFALLVEWNHRGDP